ncbi:MAG: hypothetical protein K9J75_05285 [Cyanobium usitatum Tobar12.5m-G36]|nr:hypothetical protein [Cyanobium usitatum Tobar12.5m-G36]
MDDLLNFAKVAILLFMVLVTFVALVFSANLGRLTSPLSSRLASLHQDFSKEPVIGDRLVVIKDRYEKLLKHVDQVDAAEFSAGVIETIELNIFYRKITAASAQSWIRQAPGILISLGLLGTFAGLTVGLSEISRALDKNASTAETMAALSGIVAPMGAAFQTSLLGLFLSLLVLIWTQIAGTRDCLQSCEALLSSWLETVLPQQLGSKVMGPLRQSILDLNKATVDLPVAVQAAVKSGMKEAFSTELEKVFDINSTLTAQAQLAVRQLGSVANSFNESGQDFVQAAQAFRDTDFATTLQASVQSLQESQVNITASSDGLSTRLVDVRDSLLATQSEWKLLAKTAETELQTCRHASQQIQQEIQSLKQATQSMEECNQSSTESTKQLREARLEVMRDRKLALEVAESVRARLATDASVAESCQVFADALETALSNWNRNVVRLDDLTTAYVSSVQNAKLEDEAVLAERSKQARETIEQLRNQLQSDLGSAIATQRTALAQLDVPTRNASDLSQGLVKSLTDLEARLLSMRSLNQNDGIDIVGGR